MIVIRYNRTPEQTKDLVVLQTGLDPELVRQITSADTYTLKGAVFSVVSRKYDFDTDTLIIYVK